MAISTQLQQLLRVLLPDKGFKTAGSHRDAIIAGVEESKTYTDEKAAEAVKKTGNETIAGVKTFSDGIVGNVTGNASTVTNGVYSTGNQTIGGVKTFESSPVVPDATAAQHPVTLNQFTEVTTALFYNTGLKTASINAKLLLKAIKFIQLVGDWDKTKKYIIRGISRNDPAMKYRVIIETINDSGVIGSVVFDSGYMEITEAGQGYVTFMQCSSLNKNVILGIDYNILPSNTFTGVTGANPFAITPNNIIISDLLNSSFIFKNFGNAYNNAQYKIINVVKNIQLIGDWEKTKYYYVRYLARAYSATPYYRIIIAELDNSGSNLATSVYDKILTNIVEATSGTTKLDFGIVGKKRVIAELDWVEMSLNTTVNIETVPPNYVINPNNITQIIDYQPQNTMLVDGLDYIQEQVAIGYSHPHLDLSHTSLSQNPKKGFLIFRTDDNHIMPEIVAVAEKFGYRYNMALNLAKLDYDGQENFFRILQAKGHELADHTPNHSTLHATIKNEWLPIFNKYVNNGIDKIVNLNDGKTHSIIFTKNYIVDYLEQQFGAVNGFQTVAGTNKITGDFSLLRQFTSFPTYMAYIYITSANGSVKQGWNIVKTTALNEISISDELGNALNFSRSESITCYIIQSQGYESDGSIKVTLTETATYLLLLAGQLWFQNYGLKRAQAWVQPGGDHPWLLNTNLEKAFDKLGLLWGETIDESRLLTYCYSDKYTNKRTGTWWNEALLQFDYANESNLEAAKAKIADFIALRRIETIGSHYWYTGFSGTTDTEKKNTYIQYVHAIFEFLYKNNIDLLTFTERKKILLDSTTDRGINIMPPLWVDLANRGKPDGYVLYAGVSWDKINGLPESKNCALKSTQQGYICDVNKLGGVEKGLNAFSLYAKGEFNVSVIIRDEAGTQLGTFSQTITNLINYSKVYFEFSVPLTCNTLRVLIYSNQNVEAYITNIQIKGL